ncbi:MAG: hypothetical protein RLY57_494 [Candidatus Parcubacteria bacterium]|jgi:ASC-1-like (ASCH) protein
MKTVTKKILPEWFETVKSGQKRYELRLADFEIQDGDTLRLEEWVGEGEHRKFTGRFIEKKIDYVRKVDMKDWLLKQPEINEKGMYVLQFANDKDEYDAQSESYGLLFIGVIFAIVAGLLVNIIHDYLKVYKFIYPIVVSAGLLILIKVTGKMLDANLNKRKRSKK